MARRVEGKYTEKGSKTVERDVERSIYETLASG
jgi:hypothetical protein